MPPKRKTPKKSGPKATKKSASGAKKASSQTCQSSESSVKIEKCDSTTMSENLLVEQNPNLAPNLNGLPLDVVIRIMSYLSFKDLFRMERVSTRMQAITDKVLKQVKGISTRTRYYSSRSEPASKYQCGDGIDDRTVRAVAKRCDIQFLAVGSKIGNDNCNITPGILSLSVLMPNLQRLHLESGCVYIYDTFMISNMDIYKLAKNCKKLTHVTFKFCLGGPGIEQSLCALFGENPNLTHVDLSHNFGLRGDSLRLLPSTLRHLNISDNNPFLASTMLSFVKTHPNIEFLSIGFYDCFRHYTTDTFNLWLQFLPNLRRLELKNMDQHNSTGGYLDFSHNLQLEVLYAVENNFIKLQTLKSLATLKKFRALACDSAYRALAACKSLRVLYICCTCDLNDLAYIVNSCGIQYVRLTNHEELTKESVATFIDSTPSLKGLHSWVKLPTNFWFIEFIYQYFADQLECSSDALDSFDPDRPLFDLHEIDLHEDQEEPQFVYQSALEKSTYHLADFTSELRYETTLEFGTLGCF